MGSQLPEFSWEDKLAASQSRSIGAQSSAGGAWEQNRVTFCGRSTVRESKVEARMDSRETKSPTLSKVWGWGGGQELKASPAVAHGQVRSHGEMGQETEVEALLSGEGSGRRNPLGVCAGVAGHP